MTYIGDRAQCRLSLVVILAFFLAPSSAHGEEPAGGVPNLFNYQSIITEDGRPITDLFIDLEFQILDGQGDEVYREQQPSVQVVGGAINVLIGEGVISNSEPPMSTGGISLEDLDPARGPFYLRVTVGDRFEEEDLELVSVPFSLWSGRAQSVVPDSIGSEEILDGSIRLEDLEPGLSFEHLSGQAAEGQLPASLTTDEELKGHVDSSAAHAAGAVTVRGPFISSVGSTVEAVLKDLDGMLAQEVANRRIAREDLAKVLQRNVVRIDGEMDQEAVARVVADQSEADTRLAADGAEAALRTAEDARVLDSEVSRAGDAIFGRLSFFRDDGLTDETIRLETETGDIVAAGQASLLDGRVTIGEEELTGEARLLIQGTDGGERVRIDGEDGTITLNGSVVLAGTVDGIDISESTVDLQGRIDRERTDREGADRVLEVDLEQEISDRRGADQILQSDLSEEIDDRAAADSGLQIDINTRATQTALNQEATDRSAADSGLQIDINTRATQVSLNQEISDRAAADVIIRTDVAARALQTDLNQEISNRQVGDQILRTDLSQEISDRAAADRTLQADINTRATQGSLNQETSDRAAADSAIRTDAETRARQTDLSQEASDRRGGDQILRTDLSQEISDRANADANLQGQVNSSNTVILGLVDTVSDINKVPGTLGSEKVDGTMTRDPEAQEIADSRISVAIANDTIPNSPADIGAAPKSHTHPFSQVTGSISEGQVPQFMRPTAFGTATFPCSGSAQTIEGAYNATVADNFKVNFTMSISSPYVVIFSSSLGRGYVSERSDGGFQFKGLHGTCGASPPKAVVDFVVFKN